MVSAYLVQPLEQSAIRYTDTKTAKVCSFQCVPYDAPSRCVLPRTTRYVSNLNLNLPVAEVNLKACELLTVAQPT